MKPTHPLLDLKESSSNAETGHEGTNIYRNQLVWSDDDGATWTKPPDVTRATPRARPPLPAGQASAFSSRAARIGTA